MGNVLMFLGMFLLFGFVMITFIFLTPTSENILIRLKGSVKINLTRNVGPEFGISLMKVTGIFWVLTGIIINIIGESFLRGIGGDIILGIIFLGPVWIGAIVSERRKKRL